MCLKMHTYIVHSLDYLFKLSCACHQATASTLMREYKAHITVCYNDVQYSLSTASVCALCDSKSQWEYLLVDKVDGAS